MIEQKYGRIVNIASFSGQAGNFGQTNYTASKGFADYNTPKGRDSFGTETGAEFLVRNYLSVDVDTPLFGRAQLIERQRRILVLAQ